ncbi:MAG: cache domain-containing protein [Bdellovibrionales bacterium]
MRFRYPRLLLLALIAMLLTMSGNPSEASPEHATREEAQELCEKATALIQFADIEKAKEAFQNRSSPFFDRDLYVFVFDNKGIFIAHGSEPLLIGMNGYNLRDIHGIPLVRQFLAVKDRAWVDYSWADPEDGHKIKPKSSYIIRVNDYFVGVGYYKNKIK